MTTSIQLEAEYPVQITNPNKLMWPDLGVTKLDYVRYLIEIAPYMLPHYRERVITLIRFPEGVTGHSFFQKHVPTGVPDWMQKENRIKTENQDEEPIFVDTVASLLWLGNLGSLEFHVPFSFYHKTDFPTHVAFDLDPTVPGFERVRTVALALHEVLTGLALPHVPKTSGATGMQIVIPLQNEVGFQELDKFTHTIAKYLEYRLPQDVTLERLKKNRNDKVYVDFPQFGKSRTLIGVYSARATPEATVSAPLTWREVEQGAVPADFTIFNMVDRVKKIGDLMQVDGSNNMEQLLEQLSLLT
jgi:bifunctional non-homologous end joining protein LigD